MATAACVPALRRRVRALRGLVVQGLVERALATERVAQVAAAVPVVAVALVIVDPRMAPSVALPRPARARRRS